MKLCRLPAAVICLLMVLFAAGRSIHAAQAAPLNQAHPDDTKIRVGPARPINAALLRLRSSGRYDEIYEKWFGTTN